MSETRKSVHQEAVIPTPAASHPNSAFLDFQSRNGITKISHAASLGRAESERFATKVGSHSVRTTFTLNELEIDLLSSALYAVATRLIY